MTNKQEILMGRVAVILNDRELVINLGRAHGVSSGMKFAVLDATPTTIPDPETSEDLGILDREKVRVKASEVHEKFTVCRTFRVHKVGGGSMFTAIGLSVADAFKEPTQVPETLSVGDASAPVPLSENQSFVKVKDRVRQIL